jgi:hypothetical protein
MKFHEAGQRPDASSPHRSPREDDPGGDLRFTIAHSYIDSLVVELKVNPQFTKALAKDYFASPEGIPNDRAIPTRFEQEGNTYRVGYQFDFDRFGGWKKTLEIIKDGPGQKERVLLEASRYLRNPSDALFRHDGQVIYERTGLEGQRVTRSITPGPRDQEPRKLSDDPQPALADATSPDDAVRTIVQELRAQP